MDDGCRDPRSTFRERAQADSCRCGVVRVALLVAVAAAVAAAVSEPRAASSPVVSCAEVIDRVASGTLGGYRVVLGTFSVPASFVSQTQPNRDGRWRFWSKAGLGVRAGVGAPVSVTVPQAWRRRVAIGWGNAAGASSLVRFDRCKGDGPKRWNAYAGGFVLRARSECFPLEFTVGTSKATLWFGVGRRCPSRLLARP